MREPRHRVDIEVDETTSGMFTAARVSNLSRGGLFIETGRPLPLQAPVELALKLPEIGATVHVRGRVVWTFDMRKDSAHLMIGSGIKFVDLDVEQRHVLESYLARLGTVAPGASAHRAGPGAAPAEPARLTPAADH